MFAGIDYSMSCPAITVGKNKDFKSASTFFYIDSTKLCGKFQHNIYGMKMLPYSCQEERFDNIAEWAISILKQFSVKYVCLEDYAMGAKGRVFHIGENGGVLKNKLWSNGYEYSTPKPTEVKKYFTGKGNANKILMFESFVEKTGIDVASVFNLAPDKNPISDIVDSYAMLCHGIDNSFS